MSTTAEVTSPERVIAAGAGLQPIHTFMKIVNLGREKGATDIFIRCDAPLVFISGGELQYAVDWDVGVKGVIPKSVFLSVLGALSNNSVSSRPAAFTKVILQEGWQARVQYTPFFEPQQMVVRIQPTAPYPISSYIGPSQQQTIQALQTASGLILVCGPIGSGKTSLLSSIIEMWAGSPSTGRGARHVLQLADPVEYRLDPLKYIVTTAECALTEAAARESGRPFIGDAVSRILRSDVGSLAPGESREGKALKYLAEAASKEEARPFISDVIPHILRSKINALAVGEIREAKVLRACMEFSAGKEPVVSTIHAASIAECVVRVLGMVEQVLSPQTARLLLASCLEGIFFINLAYTDKGVAVPVVEYQPMQTTAMRKMLSEGKPHELVSQIEQAQTQGKTEGAISRQMAIAAAKQAGLSESEAIKALGKLTTTSNPRT